MLAEMPVVRFLFKNLRFSGKPPKNLNKITVDSGYFLVPVLALRRLAPLGVAHCWQLACVVSNHTLIFVSTYAIGEARRTFRAGPITMKHAAYL